MSKTKIRAGDKVQHIPTGERWLVAAVGQWGEVYPAGWPCTRANADDCHLIESCDDDSHAKMLYDLCRGKQDGDPRTSLAWNEVRMRMGRGESVPPDLALHVLQGVVHAIRAAVSELQVAGRCANESTNMCRTRPAWSRTSDIEHAVKCGMDELARVRRAENELRRVLSGMLWEHAEACQP